MAQKKDRQKNNFSSSDENPFAAMAKQLGYEVKVKDDVSKKNLQSKPIATHTNIDSDVKFLIPKDTHKSLNKQVPISNFNLRMNKFADFTYNDKKDKYEFKLNPKGNLNKIIIDTQNYNQIIENSSDAVNSCIYSDFQDVKQIANSSMVIGLGSGSVYETAMTLHHIYGVPYIPGQAVKGVVRNYIIQELFDSVDIDNFLKFVKYADDNKKDVCKEFARNELKNNISLLENEFKKNNWDKDKKRKKEKELHTLKKVFDFIEQKSTILLENLSEMIKVFGTQDRVGEIIFFDSFSKEIPKVDFDVFTPHYPKYYSDNTNKIAPSDDQNPEPHVFLVVKDSNFRFCIGSNKQSIDNYNVAGTKFTTWLKDALTNHGIGAKTAVGYGYFS